MLKICRWTRTAVSAKIKFIQFMMVRLKQARKRISVSGFSLAEVLIGFVIFGAVTAGMIYGYVQANRIVEWSSQSLGATSYVVQGLERMRAAQWCSQQSVTTNGPGTQDVMPLTLNTITGVYSYSTNQIDTLDIPGTGALISITNFITVTQIHTNPTLRQIVSTAVWTFPLTKQQATITIVTLRAPDQFQ